MNDNTKNILMLVALVGFLGLLPFLVDSVTGAHHHHHHHNVAPVTTR